MTEIVAAESAGRRGPGGAGRGVLQQVKQVGMKRALELGIAANENVRPPQGAPRPLVGGHEVTQAGAAGPGGGRCRASAECAGAGAARVGGAVACCFPSRGGSRHEFGESIGTAVLHAAFHLKYDGMGRPGIVRRGMGRRSIVGVALRDSPVVEWRRQRDGRTHGDHPSGDRLALHPECIRGGAVARRNAAYLALVPDGIALSAAGEIRSVRRNRSCSELGRAHFGQRQPRRRRRRSQREPQPDSAGEPRRQLQTDGGEMSIAHAHETGHRYVGAMCAAAPAVAGVEQPVAHVQCLPIVRVRIGAHRAGIEPLRTVVIVDLIPARNGGGARYVVRGVVHDADNLRRRRARPRQRTGHGPVAVGEIGRIVILEIAVRRGQFEGVD